MRRRTPALLGSTLLCASLLLTACASDDGASTAAPPPGSTSPSPPATPPTQTPTASQSVDLDKALADALAKYAVATPPANTPKVSGAVGQKPTVAKPAGTEPTKLVIKDLVVGTGPVAPVNSTVTVDYYGVRWDNGQVFDTSFGKQPAKFPLANLIPGWQIGIPGMKEGGRRELVVPAELAYGPAGGSGGELAGKTLVFVIDLKKVGA